MKKILKLGSLHPKPHVVELLKKRLVKHTGITILPHQIQKILVELRDIVPLTPVIMHNHIFENLPKPKKLRAKPAVGKNRNVMKLRSARLLEQRFVGLPTRLFKTEQYSVARLQFSSLAVNRELSFHPTYTRASNETAIISIFKYFRRPQF